jgi:ceramide glucosyltransferase
VANLIRMSDAIRHEVVVIADSDIRVVPHYLAKTVATLEQPGVGLVTCLYRGAPESSLWARLAGMAIDYHFLPDVLVGLRLGIARPCFGSTMALRRDTLAAIGGFAAFADHLADDYAMGEAVRHAGMRVAVAPVVVAHACTERGARDLWHHELRWARTIRTLSPLGFAGSLVTHSLPLAVIGAALSGFGPGGLCVLAAALGCRLALQVQVDHTLKVRFHRWWLGPARDLLSFLVFVASFFGGVVSWRGQRFRVRSDGTMIRLEPPGS